MRQSFHKACYQTIWGKDCWGICFRDGSIAKIEKAALEVAFQTAEVVLERVT